MYRNEKEDWVASLKQVFEESALVVVTHYSGLTVAQMTDLRGQMRAAGANFKVTKNRLTRLALEGTNFHDLCCRRLARTSPASSRHFLNEFPSFHFVTLHRASWLGEVLQTISLIQIIVVVIICNYVAM